jgi:hypothetical protein
MTKARTSDLKEPRARPQPLDYNFFYDRTRNLTSFMVRNARRGKKWPREVSAPDLPGLAQIPVALAAVWLPASSGFGVRWRCGAPWSQAPTPSRPFPSSSRHPLGPRPSDPAWVARRQLPAVGRQPPPLEGHGGGSLLSVANSLPASLPSPSRRPPRSK